MSCISVYCEYCDCETAAAASAAGHTSSAQKQQTSARHVTLQQIEKMTDRSAAVRQPFRDESMESPVNNLLLRTGKVISSAEFLFS